MSFYVKAFLFPLIWAVAVPFVTLGQSDSTMIDPRDGQTYRIREIEGVVWMLENLNLETTLSYGVPDTIKAVKPDFQARWYHMNEIDSVCPPGWRLPYLDDWIGYFDYLSRLTGGSYQLKAIPAEYRLTEFNQYFDLFENGNPLEIRGVGIYQGEEFLFAPVSADYWIADLKTRKESEKRHFKMIKKSYPGTAHIHLYNEHTHIHSHKHHLNPHKPAEIRRFMCRCIREND